MYKNYLIIFLRNLVRNKTISLINLVGLTLGMTSCFLILIYVAFELSYEKQHDQEDNVYRVRMDLFEDGRRVIGLPKVDRGSYSGVIAIVSPDCYSFVCSV